VKLKEASAEIVLDPTGSSKMAPLAVCAAALVVPKRLPDASMISPPWGEEPLAPVNEASVW